MDHAKEIRPLYSELQGYLSQAPVIKETTDCIYDSATWEQVNIAIDELNTVTKKDYSRFKINPESGDDFVRISTHRTKLGGIISRLHAEYFSSEPAPFSGMPNTVINQSLSQQQTTQIAFLLEIQSFIDKKLSEVADEKEKGFLTAVKSNLANIKSFMELVQLIMATAQTFGISFDKLTQIFK